MSSTLEPRRPFDREASQRRVRHPLQTLRKYIRTYVVLEGLAVAALFLAAWFWVGVALDYGTFRLFAFDWLQELRDLAPGSSNALWARAVLLAVFVLSLAGLVGTWIVLRWLREFNDTALALVLERRFPRELGDRLITAVELADTDLARQYGYSTALVDKTIQEAEDRLERLPVAEAFNWPRLYWLWVLVAIATVGLYVAVWATTVAVAMVSEAMGSDPEPAWTFHDIPVIWTERNFLLQDTYWPRRARLEILRFKHAPNNPNEMRVGRDEQRPDIVVRAVQWVVADRAATDGWRALRWSDLDRFVDKGLLDRVDIPSDWPGWVIDFDDLDPAVPAGLLPPELNLKTAGEVRAALAQPTLATQVEQAGARDAVDELLDWRRWPVDRIALQDEKQEVRLPLRQTAGYDALQEVMARLDELAKSSRWTRTLRYLESPAEALVNYRGATIKVSEPCTRLPDNKFLVSLHSLRESVHFRVKAADYYTPTKLITLVPPPAITKLSVDKQEPAYLYHRLQGSGQEPLRGRKQIFRDYAISITGDLSTIDVPIGTDFVLRAETDRRLKEPVRMKAPAAREAGFVVPDATVKLAEDGKSFSVSFVNVVRPIDFAFEYNDEDNVKGGRRVRIRPVDDQPPEVLNVDLAAVLRKPRFKADPGKSAQGTAADAFLITPDALLPFNGTVRDDHGLTRVGWVHEVEAVDLELVGQGGKGKLPTLVLAGNVRTRRVGLVVSGLQYGPANATTPLAAPLYADWMRRLVEADLTASAGQASGEGFVLMEQFKTLLERRSIEELPITALDQKLLEPPAKRERWEHQLKDEAGFDVKRYLPKLKATNPREEAQLHYSLKLGVLATDNNLETGSAQKDDQGKVVWGNASRTKVPFQFLVVSENELLAQIAIEEESLYERLDKVAEKLKNGKTLADEQIGKLAGGADGELSLVAIRLDEVRKIVLDGGSTTREIAADYGRILKEMDVNRVAKEKADKVADKIVTPLERVVDPKAGNFVLTEDFFNRAYQGVEDDASANRGLANRKQHLQAVTDARDQLDILLDRLNGILIAMNEGILESRLIEDLVRREQEQRQISEQLRLIRQREIDVLLDVLKGSK